MSIVFPYIFIFVFTTIPLFLCFNSTLKEADGFSLTDRFFISMLTAPALIALMLYYMLWLMPHQTALFYTGILAVTGSLLFTFYFSSIKKNILPEFSSKKSAFSFSAYSSGENLFSFVLLILVVIPGLLQMMFGEVNDHDWFEYGALGKVFSHNKEIIYTHEKYFSDNGFFFIGLHGYTVPLFKTFEEFLGNLNGNKSDFFFGSISYYYNILLVSWMYVKINKKSSTASILFLLVLLLSARAFSTIFSICSIDPIRIALLYIFLYTVYRYQHAKSADKLMMIGVFGGIAAFSHSLSMLITSVSVGIICITSVLQQREKINLVGLFIMVLVFILSGSLHYLIETIWGSGWIFQNINYY